MTDITFRPTVNPAKAPMRILIAQENVDPGALANNEHVRGKLPVNQEAYIAPRATDDHYSASRGEYNRLYLSNAGSDAQRVARLNRGFKDLVYKTKYVPRYSGSILIPYNQMYTNLDTNDCGCLPDYDPSKTINVLPMPQIDHAWNS